MNNSNFVSKFYIIRKSKCFRKLFSWLAIALILLIFVFGSKLYTSDSLLLGAINGFAISLFFIFIILAIKNIPMCFRIIIGKYKVRIKKVQSMKFRHPYESGNTKDQILDFGNIRITVDDFKAGEFKIGDEAILVFVNGVKYPILIENKKNIKK